VSDQLQLGIYLIAGGAAQINWHELTRFSLVHGFIKHAGSPRQIPWSATFEEGGEAVVQLFNCTDAVLTYPNEVLFTKLGVLNNAVWSEPTTLAASGSAVIPFNAAALKLIESLSGTDKRVIGVCLQDEITQQFWAANGNAVVSITT